MTKPMLLSIAAILPLTACSAAIEPSDDVPGEDAFRIEVPAFTLQPGEETLYCYYTTLPVAADTGVKGYSSTMTEGSHHMILFFMPEVTQPDGTLSQCDMFGGATVTSVPVFAYASQAPVNRQDMPEGVGVPLKASQPVMIQMHYFNITDAPIVASVTIDIRTYAPELTYTPARAFVTFNTQISIPPKSPASFEGTCDVPAGANFIVMSTHSHQYTATARVLDDSELVVETTDWVHATVAQWSEPFRQFASNKLTYRCDYYNPTDTTIAVGESALHDEMCMAVGYFFPSDRDVFCLDSKILNL